MFINSKKKKIPAEWQHGGLQMCQFKLAQSSQTKQ